MDQAKFTEAQQAYQASDYRTAAKGFLAAAGRGAVGNGQCYHLAGNSLMKLRRYADAVTVYGHALRDETYAKRGSVLANLGSAHYALGELGEALNCYQAALDEPDYVTPYKALQCIGAVHMERGRTEDAAVAYRKAALDESNPQPSKALVNLGLCFMALGRPQDAVEAYQAALGFDGYKGRGKALSNLGQAYTALGRYEEAVKAFEKATELHDHVLSPSALSAFDAAREALEPKAELVDGWVTGELGAFAGVTSPVADMPPLETDPFMSVSSQAPVGYTPASQPYEPVSQQYEPAGELYTPATQSYTPATEPVHDLKASAAAAALGFGDDDAVNDFFTRSEQEITDNARAQRRAQRPPASAQIVRTLMTLLVVAVVIVGAAAAAYFAGFGWPTQAATVKGLLVAHQKAESVEQYWVAVPTKDVKREMAKIPAIKSFTIDSVDRGASTSTVNVTVSATKGTAMRYRVTLAREGVGWRVNGVDYNWRSTGD
ncbi:MAG TPA: tetratricopeptide repeat protein [Coriobacteriia bacterium]|nr:tetratricopeptide repeat protein [Coriobacteriia bacterium]